MSFKELFKFRVIVTHENADSLNSALCQLTNSTLKLNSDDAYGFVTILLGSKKVFFMTTNIRRFITHIGNRENVSYPLISVSDAIGYITSYAEKHHNRDGCIKTS